MPNWRDLMARQKAAVHEQFRVPGIYLTHVGGTPLLVAARIHSRPMVETPGFDDFDRLGGVVVPDDRLVFREADVSRVMPDSYFIVSETEAYRLEASDPPRHGHVSARSVRVSGDRLAEILNTAAPDPNVYPWSEVLA